MLPPRYGNQTITTLTYDKTPYERLSVLSIDFILIIAFVLFGLGVVLFIISFFYKRKELKSINKIVLITSMIFLLLLLLIAAVQFTSY